MHRFSSLLPSIKKTSSRPPLFIAAALFVAATSVLMSSPATAAADAASSVPAQQTCTDPSSLFDFTATSMNGDAVNFSSMRGEKKAYIVVNVACQCGLTEDHYAQFNELYAKYASQGLEIIAFPCNNFYQERGTDEEIKQFLADHNVKFPIMSKVDCSNSDSAHPLFPFLFRKLPSTGLLSYIFGAGLKWNFTKFLLNKDGVPIKRFEPTAQPKTMEADIIALLNEK